MNTNTKIAIGFGTAIVLLSAAALIKKFAFPGKPTVSLPPGNEVILTLNDGVTPIKSDGSNIPPLPENHYTPSGKPPVHNTPAPDSGRVATPNVYATANGIQVYKALDAIQPAGGPILSPKIGVKIRMANKGEKIGSFIGYRDIAGYTFVLIKDINSGQPVFIAKSVASVSDFNGGDKYSNYKSTDSPCTCVTPNDPWKNGMCLYSCCPGKECMQGLGPTIKKNNIVSVNSIAKSSMPHGK